MEAAVVDAIHDAVLAQHGGSEGVLDRGMIESALFRAPNLAHDGTPDAAALAAAYAYGLVRNHGYIDGNKRLAWTVARVFLVDNQQALRFDQAEAVLMMDALAAVNMTEHEVANWFRQRLRA